MPFNCARDGLEECRPATATVKLGRAPVQWRIAASTGVGARLEKLVVLTGASHLGPLLSQNTELLRAQVGPPLGLVLGQVAHLVRGVRMGEATAQRSDSPIKLASFQYVRWETRRKTGKGCSNRGNWSHAGSDAVNEHQITYGNVRQPHKTFKTRTHRRESLTTWAM